jgi:SAM-dependent methyltransferase
MMPRAGLLATVFVTGAAVLLIEVLGTRIIGPVFGVSLFVWSALLVVTLGSLATGYYAGGALADRMPEPRLLGWVVLCAGGLLAVLRLVTHPVLLLAEGFGPRGGPLLAAVALFAPCLLVLGMVGPVAVRLVAVDRSTAGKGVGTVYAVSTAGSLAGTLATVFIVLPAFDTEQIVLGAATALTLLGAALWLRHARSPAVGAALVLPLLAWLVPDAPVPPGFAVVDRAQSLYGLVEVIYQQRGNVRLLRADHSIIGAQFLSDRSPAFSFVHLLEAVRFLRPSAKDMLQLGLGIGSLPEALRPRGITTDVVEIDPAVVRFARRYFGFETKGDVFEEDARTFLRRTDRRYDVVVHDTFTGGTTPEHLLSLEVIRRIHGLLRPGGVLALNFAGYDRGPKAEASRAVARTVRAVFRHVRSFRDDPPADGVEDVGNLVFFASDEDLDFTLPPDAAFENASCRRVLRSFTRWEVLQDVPEGPTITDSRNPLARLQIPIAEDHFAAMNELLPVEVWLH